MIKVTIKDKNNKEKSFLDFKKAAFFSLNKYRQGLYFSKKKVFKRKRRK